MEKSALLPGDIRRRVEQSKRVCVFTGAGVSAESGIPTFRDAGGLWEQYRVEDLVTPEGFARDPVAVWRWHAWLQGLSFSTEPNAAHKVIAALDQVYPDFLLITQNVDDLHERGGTKRIVKLHGDIMETRCLSAEHVVRVESPLDKDAFTDGESLPKCPKCGGVTRPNVVWFGEFLPVGALETGREFAATCDLLLIVGTSGMVSGGYGFTEFAKLAGALILEVNPRESALSYLADLSIRLPAAEALPRMFDGLLRVEG